MGHFDPEVIPEWRLHANGSAAIGAFTVTRNVTRYTEAKFFSAVAKQTETLARCAVKHFTYGSAVQQLTSRKE